MSSRGRAGQRAQCCPGVEKQHPAGVCCSGMSLGMRDGPGDSGKTTPRSRKQILPGKIKALGHQEMAERGQGSAYGRR